MTNLETVIDLIGGRTRVGLRQQGQETLLRELEKAEICGRRRRMKNAQSSPHDPTNSGKQLTPQGHSGERKLIRPRTTKAAGIYVA